MVNVKRGELIMQTKICPNCNKNIAALNQVCPLCAADLTNVPVTDIADNLNYEQPKVKNVSPQQGNNNTGVVAVATNRKTKKPLIIVIVSVAVVAIAALAFFIIRNNMLTEHEKTAVEYARKIKDTLNAPDSFKLYDDVFYMKIEDEKMGNPICYFFDFTATNGYGAQTRARYLNIDGKLIDLTDISKPSYGDYVDEEDYLEALLEYTILQLVKGYYDLYNETGNFGEFSKFIGEYEDLPAKKRMSKIG